MCVDEYMVVLVYGNMMNGLIQSVCFFCVKWIEYYKGRCVVSGSCYFVNNFFLIVIQFFIKNLCERVNLKVEMVFFSFYNFMNYYLFIMYGKYNQNEIILINLDCKILVGLFSLNVSGSIVLSYVIICGGWFLEQIG